VQIATAHVEALELVSKLQAQVATTTQVSGFAARDVVLTRTLTSCSTAGTCLPCTQDSLQEVARLRSIIAELEEKHRLLEQQHCQSQVESQAALTTQQEAIAELQELVGAHPVLCAPAHAINCIAASWTAAICCCIDRNSKDRWLGCPCLFPVCCAAACTLCLQRVCLLPPCPLVTWLLQVD
jgi:hypothetical protein